MRFTPGATLGSYEILSLLGAGGMGEVYRARDPRLGREVAIKVLPEELARDAERVARFEREARSLAALNHPNVATLHGFEADGGCRFLVMELASGEDLAARIERGPIPLEEALPIFLQIAEGLEAAHEKGILHRDLKPANVKFAADGRVKILDFGLAKAIADAPRPAAVGAALVDDFTHSPTLTAQATRAGTLLGTAGYMSPEQARGLPADARADVWAFGCCFYEALTGRRPFGGEDLPQTLAAVLKDTPDWNALPADLPRHLAVLLRRSLEKNRRARVQSIGDVRVELHESLAPPTAVAPDAGAAPDSDGDHRSKWVRPSWWLAGSIALSIGAFVAGVMVAPRSRIDTAPSPVRAARLPVALHEGGRIPYFFPAPPLAISSDGRRIAYLGTNEEGFGIWLLDLENGGSASFVDGTFNDYGPFFSPDGESLGYLGDGVNVVSLSGGEPRSIAGSILWGARDSAASWSDEWVFYGDDSGAISRVTARGGGSPQTVTRPRPTERHNYPQLLPGGRHLLHSGWESSLGEWSVAVTTLVTGEETVLFRGGFAPRYLPSGHLLVAQEDVLLAMTLDLDTLEVGPPIPVLDEVLTDSSRGVAAYAVSDTGVLVYLTGTSERDGWLVRVRPGTAPERLSSKATDLEYSTQVDLSPDGWQLVVGRHDADLWVFDLATRDLDRRITSSPARESSPVWGPGEGMLTFGSVQAGSGGVYSRRADGRGPVEPVIDEGLARTWPTSWSRTGDRLLYGRHDVETQRDIWIAPAGRPEAAEAFLRTEFNEDSAVFSPDGRWVAYMSDETTRWEVYVTSYPDQTIKRKISRAGGLFPRWSDDSKRLFFAWRYDVMMVEATDSRWTPSTPQLFVEGIDGLHTWDVTPEGDAVIALEKRRLVRLQLVQNWLGELARLVPTDG